MTKTVSILGLGWLGEALALSLLAKGYAVKGSLTSNEKVNEFSEMGIIPSVIKLELEKLTFSDADFFNTDILYINFPPRRIKGIESIYPAQVSHLLPFIEKNKIEKVIFVSSTSVYPELNRTVSEQDDLIPEKGSGLACLAAEKVLLNNPSFSTTVLRFGGLIGANRNPARFMRRGIKNGQAIKPVNLIHQDDCIGIIHHVIENEIWGEVINGCSPEHPTRKEFYQLAAKVAGVDPPDFDESDTFQFKKVSSKKLVKQLAYQFKFESPIDYLNSLQSKYFDY